MLLLTVVDAAEILTFQEHRAPSMATTAKERVQVPVVTQAPQVVFDRDTELGELRSS